MAWKLSGRGVDVLSIWDSHIKAMNANLRFIPKGVDCLDSGAAYTEAITAIAEAKLARSAMSELIEYVSCVCNSDGGFSERIALREALMHCTNKETT
jgi:hypothetical protein